MGKRIGIDLGTTNSVIAVVEPGGCRILQNRENEQATRSVVGFSNSGFLIGTPGLNSWVLAPKDTVISVKRLMGRAFTDDEVVKIREKVQYDIVEPGDGTKDSICIRIGDREYYPADISAMILRKLKADAEAVLKEEVTHAVITVPAYFSDKQRQATYEAGIKAGLTVMKILDEPTAAAIAFGVDAGEKDARIVLVYDMGGGTFDVSLLMMSAGIFMPLDLEGDMWLGGDDFDDLIVDEIVSRMKKRGIDPKGDRSFMAALKLQAQRAKEALSDSDKTEIHYMSDRLKDGSGNSIFVNIDEEITKEAFEKMIQPLVGRSMELVEKALAQAGVTTDMVDCILMAGNSSRIPLVRKAMGGRFGSDKILRGVSPKDSVAIGAAMAAATLQYIVCGICGTENDMEAKICKSCGKALKGVPAPKQCPVCGNVIKTGDTCPDCGGGVVRLESGAPFPYGIQTAGDRFHVFVHKNDPVPTLKEKIEVQSFYTGYDNQRIISIPVYGGENPDCASKNVKQGEAIAFLPEGCHKDTLVRVKLWLNKNGFFELEAALEDGKDLKPAILRGDRLQKQRDELLEIEGVILREEANMLPEKKKNVKNLLNEALDLIQDARLPEAGRKFEELREAIEKPAEELLQRNPIVDKAEIYIGYAGYIAREYGWLMDSADLYELNELRGRLEEVLKDKDRDRGHARSAAAADRLKRKIDAVMAKEPQLLRVLLDLDLEIRSVVDPALPGDAVALMEELNEIKNSFKDGKPDAVEKLKAFAKKLESAAEAIRKRRRGGIKCACGFENCAGVLVCGGCGMDLTLLKAEDGGHIYRKISGG